MQWLSTWLVETTWQAALLVVVIALVQLAFGRWMSPRARYAMWMIVALRLALPVLPASDWSLYRWTGHANGGVPVAHASSMIANSEGGPHTGGVGHFAVSATVLPAAGVMPDDGVLHASAKSEPDDVPGASVNWMIVGLWVWAGGGLLMLLRLGAQSLRAAKLRHGARPLTADELGLTGNLCQQLGRVRVRESDAIASPALCGLIRPTILLPAGLAARLDKDQLEQVIRHELAHVARWDHWTNAAMRFLQAIHWFNPTIWFTFSRCKLERELACDEAVLRQAESGPRELYGRTLLAIATQLGGANREPMLTMAEGKRHLRRRIHSIAAGPKRGRSALLATVLAVAIGIAGLTRAQIAASEPKATTSSATAPIAATKPMTDADRVAQRIPELRLEATPLEEAVRVLRDTTGTTISVDWPALARQGISATTPVTLHVKDVSLGRALRLVLDSVSPKGATIGFSSVGRGIGIPASDSVKRKLVTRVYNVTDLCYEIPDPDNSATPRDQVQNIADLIRETIAVDSWKENGGAASIMPWLAGEQLVIAQDEEAHEQIEALLSQLRQAQGLQVTVECQFVSLDPAKLSPKLQMSFKGNDGVYLNDSALADLEKAIRSTPQWWMANAPRITVFNGGTARVQALANASYVSGYKVSKGTSGANEYMPVTAQAQQGLSVSVRANVSHDHKSVTLYLKPQLAEIVGMETVPWEGNEAASQHLMVQRPNVHERKMETLISVPDGYAAVMGGLAPPGAATRPATQPSASERIYVVVRPTVLLHASPVTRPTNADEHARN